MSPRQPMPPPGEKKAPAVVIGIGEAKPAGKPDDAMGGKASEADAIVLRAGDKTCSSCANYTPESGDCSAVDGNFEADDRCLRFYEAQGAGDENETAPDSDDGRMPGMRDEVLAQ